MAEQLLTEVIQLCVVTTDLDRAIGIWSDKYGVGPWHVFTLDSSQMESTVHGRPAELGMRIAVTQFTPNMQLELIQPLDGNSIYAESLTTHGGRDHVHHIKCDNADHDATIAHFRSIGVEAAQSGKLGELRYAYFDTEDDLGFAIEITARPDAWTLPEPDEGYRS
jgi:methylmalonyl-CoA/ethylmalonyl-CoA epimerase